MISLPTELLLDIIRLATHAPQLLDTEFNPDEITLSPQSHCTTKLNPTMIVLRETLPTRHALTLVCRRLNALATPILYSCILLNDRTTTLIFPSLDAQKSSMVRHVIISFTILFDWNSFESELLDVFPLLTKVDILSIYAARTLWATGGIPDELHTTSLARTMASTLGPTLRKLDLRHCALSPFGHSDFTALTSSLTRLETLVIDVDRLFGPFRHSIPFPTSMPHLKHVYLDECASTRVSLPPNMTIERLHCSPPEVLHLLSSSLSHLSFKIPKPLSQTFFTALHSSCSHLDQLTLSGRLDCITSLLASFTHFPVPSLSFGEVTLRAFPTLGDPDMMSWTTSHDTQAWIDVVAKLGREQPVLSKATVVDEAWMTEARFMVAEGTLNLGPLEECGLAVVEGESGRKLVDVLREPPTETGRSQRADVRNLYVYPELPAHIIIV